MRFQGLDHHHLLWATFGHLEPQGGSEGSKAPKCQVFGVSVLGFVMIDLGRHLMFEYLDPRDTRQAAFSQFMEVEAGSPRNDMTLAQQ